MNSPYGLQIAENCLICKLREAGFFCDLPKAALDDLERISTPAAIHRARFCLWKGSPHAEFLSSAAAG